MKTRCEKKKTFWKSRKKEFLFFFTMKFVYNFVFFRRDFFWKKYLGCSPCFFPLLDLEVLLTKKTSPSKFLKTAHPFFFGVQLR